MSALKYRGSKNAFALVALCATSFAQSPSASLRPDDYAARAKQLLRDLYPGLDSRLHTVIIDNNRLLSHDLANNFTLELHDIEPKIGISAPECWCSAPELSAAFAFDWQTENKELFIMSVVGPAVNGRRDQFAKDVNRHPEWSDAQVTKAMSAAGARFGPDHKAEFLRALPLEELKPFVGGRLEVVSAEFAVRDSDLTINGKFETALFWSVQARWHGLDGREAGCILAFEPFEGKLELFQRYLKPQ